MDTQGLPQYIFYMTFTYVFWFSIPLRINKKIFKHKDIELIVLLVFSVSLTDFLWEKRPNNASK